MTRRTIALFALLFFLFSGVAAAEDLRGLLTKASLAADKGQVFESAASLRAALVKVWSIKPISIKGAILVTQEANGYSQYQPRPNNIYKQGEPILIYTEPAGYRFKKEGDKYVFGFSGDFAVLSMDGKMLGGQKNFKEWKFSSREPLFEVFVNLTYNLTGAPPGEYQMQTTLRGLNGGGEVTFKLPIVVQ